MRYNDELSSALCDLIDVREALTEEVLNMPKDNDGTDITIGDCLDDAIAFLESISEDEPSDESDEYVCAACGQSFTDGEERDNHFNLHCERARQPEETWEGIGK